MPRLTTSSLVLGLLLPAGVHAQQQVGSDGRALDANQRVGSGGLNPTNQPLDFSARNLLITGQVTGGRQFRGDPGFSAEGSFRGTLGSDDLFRFRAESANPGGVGAAPAQRFGPNTSTDGLGGSNIIYNNYFSPSTGGAGRAPSRLVVSPDGVGAERIEPGRRIYNPGLIGGAGGGTAALENDPDEAIGRRTGADTLGRFRAADGRELQLDANPLYGVSESEVRARRAEPGGEPAEDAAGGRDTRRTFTNAPTASPEATRRDLRLGGEDAADGQPNDGTPRATAVQRRNAGALGTAGATGEQAGAQGLLPREAPGRLPGAPDPKTEAREDPGRTGGFARGGVPLAVELGSALNPVLRNAGGTTRTAASDGEGAAEPSRLERLREQIFKPLEGAEAGDEGEGTDPYLDLLRRLREGENGGGGVPRPEWMRNVTGVSDDALESAESRRASSLDRVLQGLRSGGPNAPATDGEGDEAATEEAQALAGQLAYDGPRLETLRSARKTRINESLEKAEEALAEGRYFDAESLYRQVTTDTDDQPLARVGLVHAQMAAGMNRSAALTLRSLYNDHPELISVRYAEKLLPPAERMGWLREELQKQLDDPTSPKAEPALVLAYLGRQIESRQLVRYGLALAEEARPADPLFSLLRATWLGETPAADADEQGGVEGK